MGLKLVISIIENDYSKNFTFYTNELTVNEMANIILSQTKLTYFYAAVRVYSLSGTLIKSLPYVRIHAQDLGTTIGKAVYKINYALHHRNTVVVQSRFLGRNAIFRNNSPLLTKVFEEEPMSRITEYMLMRVHALCKKKNEYLPMSVQMTINHSSGNYTSFTLRNAHPSALMHDDSKLQDTIDDLLNIACNQSTSGLHVHSLDTPYHTVFYAGGSLQTVSPRVSEFGSKAICNKLKYLTGDINSLDCPYIELLNDVKLFTPSDIRALDLYTESVYLNTEDSPRKQVSPKDASKYMRNYFNKGGH